jgi:hypothetical protein
MQAGSAAAVREKRPGFGRVFAFGATVLSLAAFDER